MQVNPEELEYWKEGVFDYSKNLKNVVEDRAKLKDLLEEHLSQFFSWDSIEFDKDFNKITLHYRKGEGVIVKSNISDLKMDWTVKSSIDNMANHILVVEIYPFGLPDKNLFWFEDELMWDD